MKRIDIRVNHLPGAGGYRPGTKVWVFTGSKFTNVGGSTGFSGGPVKPHPKPIWTPRHGPSRMGPIPGMDGRRARDNERARRQAELSRERQRALQEKRRQDETARRTREQREQQERADRLRRQQEDGRRARERDERARRQRDLARQEAERAERARRQRDLEARRVASNARSSSWKFISDAFTIPRAEAEPRREHRPPVTSPESSSESLRRFLGRRQQETQRARRLELPATRAETRVAAQEAALERSAVANIRDALSNSGRIAKLLPALTEDVRDGLPLDFLLGWIDKESSGKLDSDESVRQANNPSYMLDEVGPFQISADERQLYLRLRPTDRAKLLTDADFSVKQGVRLAKYYQRSFETAHGITAESPAVWHLVKLAHKAGLPSVQRLLARMEAASFVPGSMSWRDIKKFVAASPRPSVTLDQMSRVDVVMLRGKALADHFQ